MSTLNDSITAGGDPASYLQIAKGMLQLKIIWLGFAVIGLALSVAEGSEYSWIGWVLVAVFVAFHALWWYWRLRITNLDDNPALN